MLVTARLEIDRLILLADADEQSQRTFRTVFDRHPELLLAIAGTRKETIDSIQCINFDAIYLDVSFGGINQYEGMEVLRELKRIAIKVTSQSRTFLRTAIVVMTHQASFNVLVPEANKLGAFYFMSKPSPMTEDFVEAELQRIGLPILPAKTTL